MPDQRKRAVALYRIYNSGEIPTLAHGWRPVIALPPGRKWITLIDWSTLETARLAIDTWNRLKPLPHAGLNPRNVRAVMRRRLKYADLTQAISHALSFLNATPP